MQTTEGTNLMVQGRIVFTIGDLFKGQPKKDKTTQQPKLGKDGQPQNEFGFGLAIPKSAMNAQDPNNIWYVVHTEGLKLFPQGLPPGFALKFKDGDAIDHEGKKFSDRDGYAGHYVFACSTTIAPKFFMYDQNLKQNVQINEGIKCGDYVNVQLNVKAHPARNNQEKPGLYLNPNAVQLVGYGEAIVNTLSGDSIFGSAQPALPMGASATPTAAAPGFLVPTGAPAPMAPPAPAAPAQPHWGILPPVHQPGYQQAPQVPNAAVAAPGFPTAPAPAVGVPQQQMASVPGPATGYPPVGAPTGAFPGSVPQQGYAPMQPVMQGNGMPMPGAVPSGTSAVAVPTAYPSNFQQAPGIPVPGQH